MHPGPSTAKREALLNNLEWALAPAQLGPGLALAITDLPLSLCTDSGIARLRASLRESDGLFDYERPRLAFILCHVASAEQAVAVLDRLFRRGMAQWVARSIVITHQPVDAGQWLAQAENALKPASKVLSSDLSTDSVLLQADQLQSANHPAALISFQGKVNEPSQLRQPLIPAETMEIILDNIDAYIFIKGSDRIYRYANLPLAGLYGSLCEEIVGKDDSAFHQGESLQALWRNDDAVMQSNRPLFAEEQVFDHDGNEGWYMSRKMPIDLPGAGRCLLGMAIDITKYKTAMAGLARSELKFRSLFEASLDAVGVIDSKGNIREINDAALRMFGCADRDYFLTLKPADLSPSHQPDGRPSDLAAAEQISSAMENGTHEFEWIHHRLDTGEHFLVLVSMSRIEIDGLPAILTRERDISDQRSYEQRLQHLAYTDQLTGLSNYQGAVDWLIGRMASAADEAVLVMAFDIDDFHRFNQAYGREVGNELLIAFAGALTSSLAGDMFAARLQADEFLVFLVLCPGATDPTHLRDESEQIILNLRRSIGKSLLDLAKSWHLPTFSAGATLYLSHESSSQVLSGQRGVDALLLEVNTALKHAVRRGAGQTMFFHESMLASSKDEIRIESDLSQAIASGRLCLHYQPIVARNGDIVAAEALIRYRLEDGGLVYPDQFIPVAERKGHITPLGQQLVETACRQLADWRRLGLPIQYLSLNLSPAQLRDGGSSFSELLLDVLHRNDLTPEMIQLEITETAVLDDPGHIDEVLGALAGMGFLLAIDDFGTGYSSLSALQRLPFTTLKIDKTFVKGMGRQAKSRDLVQACVSIAHNLRLRCVAEGVDSEPDCEMLMRLGCDYFQGFLFDPGLEASVLEKRLFQQMKASQVGFG